MLNLLKRAGLSETASFNVVQDAISPKALSVFYFRIYNALHTDNA